MAIHPNSLSDAGKRLPIDTQAVRLEPFDPADAARVAAWVGSPQEAYMLAPRTVPPITPERVRGWAAPGVEAFALILNDGDQMIGYGELNVLNEKHREFWLGHLIVAPPQRGRGHGRRLTRLLLERAFELRGARRVSLVVFPENVAAIASYRAAGMYADGVEHHDLPPYHCRARLSRMAAESLD